MAGFKQTFLTKLTDVDSSAKEVLGTLRLESNNKMYKYVQVQNTTNTVASHATAGTLVAYQKVANNGYANSLVTLDVAVDADATTPFGAGALVGLGIAGTPGVSYYCWMQITGLVTLDTAVTTAAAGKAFTMSATNKTGTVAVAGSSPLGISVNTTTLVSLDAAL